MRRESRAICAQSCITISCACDKLLRKDSRLLITCLAARLESKPNASSNSGLSTAIRALSDNCRQSISRQCWFLRERSCCMTLAFSRRPSGTADCHESSGYPDWISCTTRISIMVINPNSHMRTIGLLISSRQITPTTSPSKLIKQ